MRGQLMSAHDHTDTAAVDTTSSHNSIDVDFRMDASPPPFYGKGTSPRPGQFLIEATLRIGSEESPKIHKTVDMELYQQAILSDVIEDIFYEDTVWHDSTCFAMVEKATPGFNQYETVLADYRRTLCDEGAKYKVTFYDAQTVNRKFLSKFALELGPSSSPIQNEQSACLIYVYCDGNRKFNKRVEFGSAAPPTLHNFAEDVFKEIRFPEEKQVVAAFFQFDRNYDDFVDIHPSTEVEGGSKYKITFEQSDDPNSQKVVIQKSAAPPVTWRRPGKVAKTIVEASFRSRLNEVLRHQEVIDLQQSQRTPIMDIVFDILEKEIQWAKQDCYVVIQQYNRESGEFVDVAEEYEAVTISVGDKFNIQFLDASCHARRNLPKHTVKIEKDSDVDSIVPNSKEPAKSQILVEGKIAADGKSSDFQDVVTFTDMNSITVQELAERMHEIHVEPSYPRDQFVVTVCRFDERFKKHVTLNENYARVKIADNERFSINFTKNHPDAIKKAMSILIPETAFPSKTPEPSLPPPLQTESTVEKKCGAFVEAIFKSGSHEMPPFNKYVEFQPSQPVTLITAILTIFYEDTSWSTTKCYACVQKKVHGFDHYMNVTSDYENVHLEDTAKYRIVFYDAATNNIRTLPKYCVPLEPESAEEDPEPQEESEDDESEEDETDEEEEEPELNFIKFKGRGRRNGTEPKKKTLLSVICPRKCSGEKRTWICAKCSNPVFYDFADNLFCKCGAYSIEDATYCCGDDSHGNVYVPHANAAKLFRNMKNCEEINIVLMGETGAGKSTWIDALFNYILYAGLDEALDSELEIPIPTHFLLEDDDGYITKIYVGEKNDNENQEVGQSATQRPKSYTFNFNGKFYRFIDVPGVGDSRGVDQDRKNFEMIMQELYNYEAINAFCVLIPSDAPRLTVSMKYCINELLTHLHQDAAKNLLFCFTKSRMNFYKAGNTQDILKNYLKNFKNKRNVDIKLNEKTMYYFDNESFKFLCAIENGIDSLMKDKSDFVKSWNISAKNTYKALDYMASLEPHMMRDMMSLNEAKRIILELTPISAEITKNIQTNKRIIEAKKVELQEMKKQTVDLRSQLAIKQTSLEAVPLDYPKTVCAAAQCIETIAIPGTKESQVHYKTICHDHCYLSGIEPGTYPNLGLQGCAAMGGTMNCRRCECSWDTHLHIRYEQKQVTVDIVNKEVDKIMASKNTNEVSVSDVIKGLENRINELTLKEKRIKTICAKFVAFLNKNAIAVINDAYGEYLEQSIKLAKNEVAVAGEGNEKVEQLEKYLAEYRAEVAIINDCIAKGTENITVTSIEQMKQELEQMDELGDQFKSFLKASDDSQKTYQREDEVHNYSSGGAFMSALARMTSLAAKAGSSVTTNIFVHVPLNSEECLSESVPFNPNEPPTLLYLLKTYFQKLCDTLSLPNGDTYGYVKRMDLTLNEYFDVDSTLYSTATVKQDDRIELWYRLQKTHPYAVLLTEPAPKNKVMPSEEKTIFLKIYKNSEKIGDESLPANPDFPRKIESVIDTLVEHYHLFYENSLASAYAWMFKEGDEELLIETDLSGEVEEGATYHVHFADSDTGIKDLTTFFRITDRHDRREYEIRNIMRYPQTKRCSYPLAVTGVSSNGPPSYRQPCGTSLYRMSSENLSSVPVNDLPVPETKDHMGDDKFVRTISRSSYRARSKKAQGPAVTVYSESELAQNVRHVLHTTEGNAPSKLNIGKASPSSSSSITEQRQKEWDHSSFKSKEDEPTPLPPILQDFTVHKRSGSNFDKKVITMVLLGETGVGKSTLINGIVNYMSFSTLAEAQSSSPKYMIPALFSYSGKTIRIGQETDNEHTQNDGESATQRPKVYEFEHGDEVYKIIDVPGIGDSRGVDQDRQNFDYILDEINRHEVINAFCILLPSNAARITVAMRYCIYELLSNLHKDAAKNIVFCFTKARSTFYKAGSTLPLLHQYLEKLRAEQNVDIQLKKDNMFFFDNEPFNYLWLLANGINLSKERKAYDSSFNVSRDSTLKLFDYVKSLPPHDTTAMKALTETRRLILHMVPISAETNKKIQLNKSSLEAQIEKLKQSKAQKKSLEDFLTYKEYYIKTTPLKEPRTVCAAASCIQKIPIGASGRFNILYKQICHKKCHLSQIELGKFPNPALKCCAVFICDGKCKECGCKWDQHMHLDHLQEIEEREVVNKELQKTLKEKGLQKLSLADVVKSYKSELDQLVRDEQLIKKMSAKFSTFLRNNSISIRNDVYADYLKYTLKMAEQETSFGGSYEKVAELQASLKAYEEEVKFLQSGGVEKGVVTIEHIYELKKQLRGLAERHGEIKDLLHIAENSADFAEQKATTGRISVNGNQSQKGKNVGDNEIKSYSHRNLQ
ncbi:hypothetical protein QR680_004097 [Steinernema hermaphroditum]|uniref:DUF8206 domain-containing protein n=1 Tax=Steinernema hermaphroditum TaxID=289476 RepID=A0AA39HMN2_9BILA|nr:hypothetical protein QR680_004097 [Steinernema hermaphroditum]